MLKKVITYENLFTNQQVTEEHYFHISKADMVEMEMSEHKDEYTNKKGEKLTGIQAKLSRIVESEDGKGIMAEFKDMIRRAYGKKEGDRFIKSPEIAEEFMGSEAFSQLLWDICTDAGQAAEFINGIFPGDLDKIASEVQERAQQMLAEQAKETAVTVPPRVLQDGPPAEGSAHPGSWGNPSNPDVNVVDPTGLTNPVTPRVLTEVEAREMDYNELKSGLATGRYKLS